MDRVLEQGAGLPVLLRRAADYFFSAVLCLRQADDVEQLAVEALVQAVAVIGEILKPVISPSYNKSALVFVKLKLV